MNSKYIPIEHFIIISSLMDKHSENRNKIAEYMCYGMIDNLEEYEQALKSIKQCFRSCRRILFSDKQPITEEKIKRVREQLNKFCTDDRECKFFCD